MVKQNMRQYNWSIFTEFEKKEKQKYHDLARALIQRFTVLST